MAFSNLSKRSSSKFYSWREDEHPAPLKSSLDSYGISVPAEAIQESEVRAEKEELKCSEKQQLKQKRRIRSALRKMSSEIPSELQGQLAFPEDFDLQAYFEDAILDAHLQLDSANKAVKAKPFCKLIKAAFVEMAQRDKGLSSSDAHKDQHSQLAASLRDLGLQVEDLAQEARLRALRNIHGIKTHNGLKPELQSSHKASFQHLSGSRARHAFGHSLRAQRKLQKERQMIQQELPGLSMDDPMASLLLSQQQSFMENLPSMGLAILEDDSEIMKQLSEKQKHILRGLCSGLSQKEIALELGVSQPAVHYAIKSMKKKLEMSAPEEPESSIEIQVRIQEQGKAAQLAWNKAPVSKPSSLSEDSFVGLFREEEDGWDQIS